jgi:hypothetical protein
MHPPGPPPGGGPTAMQPTIPQVPPVHGDRTQPTATADNPIETFMGRPFQRSPLVAADDHHWDIMAEFLGLYEPGLVRRNIAIAGPQGPAARFRARIATRRAWADLIYTDTAPQERADWMDSMPPEFKELTDDYALAALMMWTYADLRTAPIFKIFAPDPEAQIFNTRWMQLHLPAQRIMMISATEQSWLCPSICRTCAIARLSCPECRMAARHWPTPATGSGLELRSNIRDHPPCGAGHYLPPRDRAQTWDDLMMYFKAFIDAQDDARDSQPGS